MTEEMEFSGKNVAERWDLSEGCYKTEKEVVKITKDNEDSHT